MARTKKAAKRAPEAAEEAEVAEVVDGEKVAEAPPKKGRKNKKEAPGKDAEQPLPKKLRSSNKEEEAKKDEEKPSAKVSKVAKVKIDPAKADVPLLVFAHGAGAPSSHEWMVRFVLCRLCLAPYICVCHFGDFARFCKGCKGLGV